MDRLNPVSISHLLGRRRSRERIFSGFDSRVDIDISIDIDIDIDIDTSVRVSVKIQIQIQIHGRPVFKK